jgi:hypothetical protein
MIPVVLHGFVAAHIESGLNRKVGYNHNVYITKTLYDQSTDYCPSKFVFIIHRLGVANVCTTVQNDVCELHVTTPGAVIASLNINVVYMFVLL